MLFLPEKTFLNDLTLTLSFADSPSSEFKENLKAKGKLILDNPSLDETQYFSLQFWSTNDFVYSYDKDFLLDPDFSKVICKATIDYKNINYKYLIKGFSKTTLTSSLLKDSINFFIFSYSPKDIEYYFFKDKSIEG